jgi:hypothetical protein
MQDCIWALMLSTYDFKGDVCLCHCIYTENASLFRISNWRCSDGSVLQFLESL